MSFTDKEKAALDYHAQHRGKIAIALKTACESQQDLALAYTPGVAVPCLEIEKNPELVYKYTNKANSVAVVTDGSAVLGLGNIGAAAGMPVMEGKALLFKKFADVDAYPICLSTQDSQKIIETVKNIAPGFGGINLEDISAPRCFEIEEALIKELDIPVFHDDQHGTAIVALAGLLNALQISGKKMDECRFVFNGAGAAAIAIAKLFEVAGMKKENMLLFDSKGLIFKGRSNLNPYKQEWAANMAHPISLEEALDGADVFIGVSVAGALKPQWISKMSDSAMIFAMANPVPEIMPEQAKAERPDCIMATGRSDFANQVNNVLGFPGIFRGALDVRARKISVAMKIAAAQAIASLVSEEEKTSGKIIPSPLDERVVPAVAKAVADKAREKGLARL